MPTDNLSVTEAGIPPSKCLPTTVGMDVPLLKGLDTIAAAHKLFQQRQSFMDNVVPLAYSNIYQQANVLLAVQAMQQLSSAAIYEKPFYSDVFEKDALAKKGVTTTQKIHDIPKRGKAVSVHKRREKKAKVYKFKRRAKSEKKSWTRDEIVLLLQAAKLLLHRDLKTITKAIYACIDRKPGKCWGRGAEKKLKRILCFQNWRTADKAQVSRLINKRLKEYDAEVIPHDSKIYLVAKSLALK